jgi:serine/threonine protein kinase
MAPELIDENRTSPACDVWGAGVVLFVMLVGYPPFWGESDEEILERTRRGRLHMFDNDWKLISDSARNLVLRMLNVDHSKRISSDEVLQHPWIALNAQRSNTPHGIAQSSTETRPPPNARQQSLPKDNPQVPCMSRDPSPLKVLAASTSSLNTSLPSMDVSNPSLKTSLPDVDVSTSSLNASLPDFDVSTTSSLNTSPPDIDLSATKLRMKQYFVHYKTRNRIVHHNHSSNARAFSHSVSSPTKGTEAKSFIQDFMEKEQSLFEEDFMSVGLKAGSSVGITLYATVYKNRGPKLPVGPFFDMVDKNRDGYVNSSDIIHCIDRILKCDDEFLGIVFDVYADDLFDVSTVCDGYESDLQKRNAQSAEAKRLRESGKKTITRNNVLRVYAMISGTDPMLESNLDFVDELFAGFGDEVCRFFKLLLLTH